MLYDDLLLPFLKIPIILKRFRVFSMLYMKFLLRVRLVFLDKQGVLRTYSNPFFILFGVFRPTENFSLIRRRHHYDEGVTILTYARHLWPFSSEGF